MTIAGLEHSGGNMATLASAAATVGGWMVVIGKIAVATGAALIVGHVIYCLVFRREE